MKKRLNLITFMIGVAIGLSLYSFLEKQFVEMKAAFMAGYEAGSNEEFTKMSDFFYLTLEPVDYLSMPDSLYNKKANMWIPARISNVCVDVPVEPHSDLDMIWILPLAILLLAGFIIVIINFFKIIVAVNKSIIFDWVNVRRLRRIGVGLGLMFLVHLTLSLVENNRISKLVDFEHYTTVGESFNGGALLAAMIAFLMAEIFAVGLRLKEEQELTI